MWEYSELFLLAANNAPLLEEAQPIFHPEILQLSFF